MLRSANDKRNTVVSTAKLSSFLAIINYIRPTTVCRLYMNINTL